MENPISSMTNYKAGREQLTAKIIWIALLFSVAIYAGLAFALSSMPGFKPMGASFPPSAKYIFYLVGAGSAVGGVFLFKSGRKLFRTETSGGASLGKSLLAPMVVCWALCETSAIMGLVIFFIFGELDALWHLSAVAVLGLALCYPSSNLFQVSGAVE